MKRAVIIYQSKTGTTKNYAQEISAYIQEKQIESYCIPIQNFRDGMLQNADYFLLGCWTKGLMVIFQKPDKTWIDFTKNITVSNNIKVALFATYKIKIGSMFKNMAKYIKLPNNESVPNLKSRHGDLSENDKLVLDEYISN